LSAAPEVRERAIRMVLGHPGALRAAERGSAHPSQRPRRAISFDRLAEAGIESSVGSVGDSYDNALAETVIGLYKTEVIHCRGPWRNAQHVEYAALEWVDWFNNRRLL